MPDHGERPSDSVPVTFRWRWPNEDAEQRPTVIGGGVQVLCEPSWVSARGSCSSCSVSFSPSFGLGTTYAAPSISRARLAVRRGGNCMKMLVSIGFEGLVFETLDLGGEEEEHTGHRDGKS